MKTKTVVLILIVAVLAAAAGWFAARQWPAAPPSTPTGKNGRKVAYYQSAMHPWIKSDKPGKCTICGMELVPVYEGEKGFEAGEGVVALPSNSVTVLNVRSVPVRRAPLTRTLRVAGTIDDDDTRHRLLSAYVDGRIDRLFVNYVGAEVQEGQPLATFYSAMLLAAEREYQLLLRQQSKVSGAENAPLLAAATQRLRQYGLNERQIAALADKPPTNIHTELLAPVSGTVVARFVYEGQYVKEGERLFELADFSTMWFMFDAYERDLTWLRPGAKVSVTTPALPGRVFDAAVTFIDPNLNPTSRTARVRAEIPNPVVTRDGQSRRELLHKVYAEATVSVDIPESLAIPRSAVLSPGGRPVVYVDRGGAAYEQRAVKLGRAGDELWEITDGLREGEMVVVNGNLLIDAQAQLNQSVQAPVPVAAPDGARLTDAQRSVAHELLKVVAALGSALAADKLEDFNREAAHLHTAAPALVQAFAGVAEWANPVGQINAVAHISNAADLKAARKAFAPLSLAAVDFAQRLRLREADFASLKVYLCPMTEDAFPGAPKRGTWLQLAPPLRNPYFGSEMLECGQEVK